MYHDIERESSGERGTGVGQEEGTRHSEGMRVCVPQLDSARGRETQTLAPTFSGWIH